MMNKKVTLTPRHLSRPSVKLDIELPVLSDEAAAAMADVLVQLYHRFEATYYAQILNHHADQAFTLNTPGADQNKEDADTDPF